MRNEDKDAYKFKGDICIWDTHDFLDIFMSLPYVTLFVTRKVTKTVNQYSHSNQKTPHPPKKILCQKSSPNNI